MKHALKTVAVMAVACVAGCGGPGVYQTVTGTVIVERGCADVGGFDETGKSYLIRTEDGTVIGDMSNLLGGVPVGADCMFLFVGSDVERRDRYLIDAGRRGELLVSGPFDVDEDDGSAKLFEFTLGD